MYIIDENRPECKYEGVALAILEGKHKYDEPFGIAATDFYDHEIAEGSLKGKRALSIILSKMIFDNKPSALINQMLELDNTIWRELNSKNASEIIDKIVRIANELGY